MCCGVPPDLYDVVVLGEGATAPELLDRLGDFELTVITGHARPDPDDGHYLDVDGRLIYGAQVVDTVEEHRTIDGALEALASGREPQAPG